jgi:hypothetical protein
LALPRRALLLLALVPSRVAAQDTSAPRACDPWSALRDVPGILVDRVNVGGSETAQQSLILSHGDLGSGTTWTLDGIDVTDPAALGFTSLFPDMDALAEVTVRTTALDARSRTPGAQVTLSLRESPERFAGAGHLRGSSHLLEVGGEAGGPVGRRLRLWGAASESELRQETRTGHDETLRLTSILGKARLALGSGALTLLALRGEKVYEERDTTLIASPEARWRQSGPVHLLALTDARTLGAVSLTSRVSWLDAGFRLDPQGGTARGALEDMRGVMQRSYLTFDTRRPRSEASVTATARPKLFGLAHDLTAGASYARSAVTTRAFWPGDGVIGFERQDVFFRTFRLTGFAQLTRDQAGRSVQDVASTFLQDSLRFGRLSVLVGARLDRLAGRSLASSVEANSLRPDLLPGVRYAGSEGSIRWLDLLPRAALTWDVDGDGRAIARLSYAGYAAPLGTGDVSFDDPVGRETASITYLWDDRDGDRVVDADEIVTDRGQKGASGLDPLHPDSAVSPHAIEPGLRSPRTHELTGSVEERFGKLTGRVQATLRRTTDVLWRPLRNLTRADYVASGAATGTLFGRDYNVTGFAPLSTSSIVPGNGRVLANRPGYRQDAFTFDAEVVGSLWAKSQFRAWGALMDWRERFLDPEVAIQDPTPLDGEPLRDRGRLAARPGGLGRGDVFVSARWAAGLELATKLPARFEASTILYAREGFPIPYFKVTPTGDPSAGAKSILVAPELDSYRLPALILLDARLARRFALGRGELTLGLDVFNLLDRDTPLQAARDVELPRPGKARERVRSRVGRIGLEYRF